MVHGLVVGGWCDCLVRLYQIQFVPNLLFLFAMDTLASLRPEGAETYQPRARPRKFHERCRRPGKGVHPMKSPERAKQNGQRVATTNEFVSPFQGWVGSVCLPRAAPTLVLLMLAGVPILMGRLG